MYEILFIIFATLYFIISIKIDSWITISILGFKSETPQLFLLNPKYYEYFRAILFIGAVGTVFMISVFSWYISVSILFLLWISAGSIGRKKACSNYRKIFQEMLLHAETDKEKSNYLKELKKTDQELMEEVSKTLSRSQ